MSKAVISEELMLKEPKIGTYLTKEVSLRSRGSYKYRISPKNQYRMAEVRSNPLQHQQFCQDL